MDKDVMQVLEQVAVEGARLMALRKVLYDQYRALNSMEAMGAAEGTATTLLLTAYMSHGQPSGTYVAVPNRVLQKIIPILKNNLDDERAALELEMRKLAVCLRLVPNGNQ